MGFWCGFLEPSWGNLGAVLEPSWENLGAILGSSCLAKPCQFHPPNSHSMSPPLGAIWDHLGTISEPSWSQLGSILGASQSHLGSILRVVSSGLFDTALFRPPWNHLGAISGSFFGAISGSSCSAQARQFHRPPKCHSMPFPWKQVDAVLESSWGILGHLGAILGASRSYLGFFESFSRIVLKGLFDTILFRPSWNHLGAFLESFWGHLGFILPNQALSVSAAPEVTQHASFLGDNSGPSWGHLRASWGHLRAIFGAS